MTTRALLMTSLLVVAGCGEIDDQLVPTGDEALFVEQVQLILGPRCGNPSCHGNDQRPFQLYARRNNRMAPNALHSDAPLSDEELEHNRYSAASLLLDVDQAHDSPLLTKPLAPAAGGSEHGGDTQFYDAGDDEYVTLLTWARGVVQQVKETP
jgi:hypothetical protein